jgi:hypothetical protein
MECINLQEQFGTRYRVTFDAAYNPKHVPRDKLDPCMMQMPCERGTVYPHGGGLLAVEVEGRRVRGCHSSGYRRPMAATGANLSLG